MILLVTYTAKPHCREAFLRAVQESSLPEIVRQQTHLRQPHMQQLKRWKEQYIAETAVEKI